LTGIVSADDLIAGARAADIKVARACFAILKHRQLLDPPALFNLMLGSPADIIVAVEAIHLCVGLPADSRREQYLAATRSHFGAVRTIALRGLLGDEGVTNRHELAATALFELQSSVREIAITYLKVADFDLRSFYREARVAPGASVRRTVEKTLEERGDVLLLLRFSESQKWEWLDCIARLSLRTPPDITLIPALSAALEKWVRQAGGHYDTATPEQKRFLSSDGTLSALEKLLLPDHRSLMARLRLELSA
jgi:hypothetical protein